MNDQPTPIGIPGLTLPDVPDATPVGLTVNGVTLGGYFLAGAPGSPALLIAHGWGEDAATHLPTARFFRTRGYHVLSVSQRGWRGSGGCDDYGLRQPDDVCVVLQWLQERTGAADVFLFGFSQGGLVTLLALTRDTNARAAAVVNAPVDVRDFAARTSFPFVTRYLQAVCSDGLWEDRSPLLHAARIRVPVLLFASEQDRQVPPDHARRMHERLPGSVLRVLPAASHAPTHTEWDTVRDETFGFFEQFRRPGPTGSPP